MTVIRQLPIRRAILTIALCMVSAALTFGVQPNIVLCMADDQGGGIQPTTGIRC